MIGVKNKGYAVPLYDSLERQVRWNCQDCNYKGILSPANAMPHFGIKLNNPSGQIFGIIATLKSNCDPSFSQDLDSSLFQQSFDEDSGTSCVEYVGGTFDEVPDGTYYVCLNIGGVICYSEELRMCGNISGCGPESVGLSVVFEEVSCCDEFVLPTGEDRMRMFYRNYPNNTWIVYSFAFNINAYLMTIGANNIQYNYEIINQDTGNTMAWTAGGNPADLFAYAIVPDSTQEVMMRGSATFDWNCPSDGLLHSITLEWEEVFNQVWAGSSNTWDFIDVDSLCIDNTPSTKAIITANDSIGSNIVSEQIDNFSGFNWTNIGTSSAELILGPSPGSIFLRRIVDTGCNENLSFSQTYNF